MNSKVIAGVIVLVLVVVAAFLFVASSPDNSDSSQSNNSAATASGADRETQNNQKQTLETFTLEEVATHNSREDCWTVINGSVYNLTSYIPRHSGGDNILSACGVDATSYFNGQQAGQLGEVNDHTTSSTALSQLSQLKIGTLAD